MSTQTFQNQFGESIRKARMDLGISLRDAAKQIGISPSYMSNLEQNIDSCTPDDDLIKKISEVVKVKYSELKQLAKGNTFKSLRRSLSETDVNNIQAFYQVSRDRGISTSTAFSIFTKALDEHEKKSR